MVATVSADDGAQVAPPEISFRGVPFLEQEETDELIEELRDVAEDTLAAAAKDGAREPVLLQEDLHDDIAAFIYERLRRRPWCFLSSSRSETIHPSRELER